jgi:hypothetical protein
VEATRFQWTGVQFGWIGFVLTQGDSRYACTVGDTNDVPREMLQAVARTVSGSVVESVSFDHEPAEVRVTIRCGEDAVRFEVGFYSEWGDDRSGETRWIGWWSDPTRLGSDFLEAFDGFVDEIGEDGYSKGWPDYPFPSDARASLAAALDARGPTV